MDQGGRLQRLSGRFLGHFLRGEFAQLIINQRQELGCRLRIAGVDGVLCLVEQPGCGGAALLRLKREAFGQSVQLVGLTAEAFGPVGSVVFGGIGTIVVVLLATGIWPELLRLGSLHDLTPAPAPENEGERTPRDKLL